MTKDAANNYGYEYVCPITGLVDYVGVGCADSRSGQDDRMLSHLKGSSNGMLRCKLDRLNAMQIEPIARKVVEGLTREEIYEWETSRIFGTGTIRSGTGTLFNVCIIQPDRPFRAFGKSFKGLRGLVLCPQCRVDARVLEFRIASGWDVEAAVTTPSPAVEAFGESFADARQLHADARCLVPYEALLIRLHKGEAAEVAATRPLDGVGAWGERFPTLQALADDPRCLNTFETLLAEVKRGCEQQAATSTGSGPARMGTQVFPSLRELIASPRCVVSQGVFLDRVRRLGWTTERAATEPVDSFEFLGQASKSFKELVAHPYCKYDEATVLKHLKQGREPEYAIGAWQPRFGSKQPGQWLRETIEDIRRDGEQRKMDLLEDRCGGWEELSPDGSKITLAKIEREMDERIKQAERDDEIWQIAERAIRERHARQLKGT